MFAHTSMISMGHVPKTTSQHPSSIKLSMHVLAMRPFPSWMDFLDITKSRSRKKIVTRLRSQPHGAHSHIESCPLAWKTLEPPPSAPWHTVSTTSFTSCWFVLTTSSRGHRSKHNKWMTCDKSTYDVASTESAWTHSSVFSMSPREISKDSSCHTNEWPLILRKSKWISL